MTTPFEGFGTSSGSALQIPGANKSALTSANNPVKTKQVEKAEVFPTVATGAVPTAPTPASTDYTADFYRFGKFLPGGQQVYEIWPRTFEEFDDDKRTASVRIFGQGPKDKKPRDFIPAYTKFLLESVTESHVERSQIVETFGDFYVFLFGERPPVYNFTGQLINAKNANWVSDWMFMYSTYLRGTRCVERNAKAIITYGGRQVEGFMLSTTNNTAATIEGAVGFQFQVVVTERKFLGFSPDFGFSSADNENLKSDDNFRKLLDQVAGIQGTGTSNANVSKAQGVAKKVMAGGSAAGISSIA